VGGDGAADGFAEVGIRVESAHARVLAGSAFAAHGGFELARAELARARSVADECAARLF
jgi:hypothetical protein